MQLVDVDLALGRHLLKGAGTYNTCIRLAVENGMHHGIMGSFKTQLAEILLRIDSMPYQFTPPGMPATERPTINRSQVQAFKVLQANNFKLIGTGKNHTAEQAAALCAYALLHGDDGADAVKHFKFDIESRVGKDKVYLTLAHSQMNFIEA